MGADNSKPSQTQILIGLFGRQIKVGPDYIWTDFRGRTLLGSPVIFSKIMFHDGKVWVFLPIKADISRLASLDTRINYDRTIGALYTVDVNFGTAVSLMRAAVRGLRGMAPSPISDGNAATSRGDYADLVQMVRPEMFHSGSGPHARDTMRHNGREQYQSYDDGHDSNLPGALVRRDSYDTQFYDGLQAYSDYPYAQRTVGVTRTADRVINSGVERMSNLTEDIVIPEANYQQSGDMFAAQILSMPYYGPIELTNANFDPVNNVRSDVASVNGSRTSWPAAYVAGGVDTARAPSRLPGDARERFQSNDVRFQPLSAFIYYDIGSDTNSIDRTYGTVANGVRYPQMTDVLAGWTTTRPRPVSETEVAVSKTFKPVSEHFSADPFMAMGALGGK